VQKTLNSQSNPEQKDQHWKYHNTWLHTILQNHSNKNSRVLAKSRHIDQWNRRSGNKSPQLQSSDLQQSY
jgi:hypothetical protein